MFRLSCVTCKLLLYQESISDFYWYYSGKDVMDEAGQRNFSKALAVAKQIFNSLTEYIQVQYHNSFNNNISISHSYRRYELPLCSWGMNFPYAVEIWTSPMQLVWVCIICDHDYTILTLLLFALSLFCPPPLCSTLSGPGSMYWEPAEPGPQQAMGCSGGFPTCVRQHADETITGNRHYL